LVILPNPRPDLCTLPHFGLNSRLGVRHPDSPELTQASWFRVEDKQAAKAAAEVLKFSVID
jgi:hypothetical protein